MRRPVTRATRRRAKGMRAGGALFGGAIDPDANGRGRANGLICGPAQMLVSKSSRRRTGRNQPDCGGTVHRLLRGKLSRDNADPRCIINTRRGRLGLGDDAEQGKKGKKQSGHVRQMI